MALSLEDGIRIAASVIADFPLGAGCFWLVVLRWFKTKIAAHAPQFAMPVRQGGLAQGDDFPAAFFGFGA